MTPPDTDPRVFHILVLCTGNSARSIMAEALLNTLGQGRLRAHSAGSHPTGTVNPLAIEKARSMGYPAEALRSKSWDEFAMPDAPRMDLVLTVCDNAAGEACPFWPGGPASAHWGFEDPAAVEGDVHTRRQAFDRVFRQITARVRLLLELPLATLDRPALRHAMDAIGARPVVEA